MARTVITATELALLAGPSVDRRAIRFEMNGRQFRAMSGEPAALFRDLLQSPRLDRLFQAGLVRFWESDVHVEGADLVLELEPVEVVTYPQEWPTAMLREAGLAIARLGSALAVDGLGTLDAHPWNILFSDARPVWIDLGSIARVQQISNGWVDEFRRHIILPLTLRRLGWQTMADALWQDHPGVGIKAVWDRRLSRTLFPPRYKLATRPRDPTMFFESLQHYLEDLQPHPRSGEWSDYVQAPGVQVGETDRYSGKQRAVDAFLSSIPAGSVLDVGANAGWYSELAIQHGNRVVAIDTDDAAASRLFTHAREQALPIHVLRLNVMWPTGSHGLGLTHAPATERLRSDVSLWLAVVHHLAGRQGLSFQTIARAIDQFTRSTAIVEFIPRDDVYVRSWPVAGEPWYDLEDFIAAMRPYFGVVDVLPSSPEPRTMLCFRRGA